MHRPIFITAATRLFFTSACIMLHFFCAGQTASVQLHIIDSIGQPIAFASIHFNQKKCSADSLGHASILLAAGNYLLNVSAVNHYTFMSQVQVAADTILVIKLQGRQSLLGNITVYNSRNITRNQLAVQSISSAQLKKLPVILGEVDPLKTITLLPGIKSGGEASAGIYVRGGGPDQNLVLLDGIPVYNPSHLFGFFSIFNGDAVNEIEVIKGGIPAEYGGRLSSVIAINSKEANMDSVKGSGGIGFISSRFSLEVPLINNKLSLIISARRTYIDQIAKAVAKKRIGGNGYHFYDANAKLNYRVNKNNALQLTYYSGQDFFDFSRTEDGRTRLFNTNWGNMLAGISWKQQITKSLQQQTAAVYNDFALDSRFAFNTTSFVFTSALKDKQLKSDWMYTPQNWLRFKWGGQYTWHQFNPGAGAVTTGIQAFKSQVANRYAKEAAAYASAAVNITPALNLIAGIRYSYFNQVGPTQQVLYGSDGVPTGRIDSFKKGQSIARYHYPEPRLSLLYKLSLNSSIKASYTRTIQYLHLATTSGATFPSDLWLPSSKLIQPAKAQQWAAGFFSNLRNNAYELNVEVYYKTLTNQIEFKPGALLLLNQNLEGEMIFGKGKAYGIEFFIQKKKGRLTGWIGYTLSRAERTFNQLNNGKSFAYRYDRLHDLSVVANYPLSKKWEAAAVFVYGTGNAITLPTGRFTYNLGLDAEDQSVLLTNINQYSNVNAYRMPAYHRLDVAFIYTPKPMSKKKFKSSWNFSVYNIYNRYNPYFIYLDANEEQRSIAGKKVFLFPVVPSVTWNFRW
ncbi:MAG: hypothetical protein RL172_1887 [Bacteroidota bacterium]|jgi:outer membrane cobalamin receptor